MRYPGNVLDHLNNMNRSLGASHMTLGIAEIKTYLVSVIITS